MPAMVGYRNHWATAAPTKAVRVERLANQRLHLVRNEVSDSLDPGWVLSRWRSTSGPPRHFVVTAFT
ncbi:hypothetical protein TNCV_3497461 [Trichonephila clavipes]|nr:hypothetical protein TNCV_3497461 [Trichonephila clavipes]